MKAFASFIVRRNVAWAIVVIVLGLSALFAYHASRVVQDDDMLAFLPKKNPEVAGFYEVSQRFGSMDVALVGIESDDVFAPDFMARLKALTKRLKEAEGLEYTLSLTSVEDVTVGPGGELVQDPLVQRLPRDEAESKALRERVLSRDHIVGNLVSADGRAVLLYVFARPGSQPRDTAQKVRSLVDELFPGDDWFTTFDSIAKAKAEGRPVEEQPVFKKKYWGGAPFISTYIYDVTQRDLRRLAPWACLAIAVMVLLSFKDLLGTGLSLLATLLGVVFPLGIMGLLGVHTNIVLGSMPVILFALGSAYGVHILTRFYALSATHGREDALRTALEEVGPSVLGSGITTVFGLLSFVMMDIKPMRTFGIFTAVGLTIALVLAVTFVPAVLVVSPLRGRVKPSLVWVNRLMARLCIAVQRRRLVVGVLSGLVAVAAGYYSLRVDSRMDTAAFFDKGSPPAAADDFMREHFGGSQFIQVQIQGDMTDPETLREVQLLGDRIAALDGVSSVQHIGGILAQVNEAVGDRVRRVPTTARAVVGGYVSLQGHGDAAIAQLVTDNHDFGLVNVKVRPTRASEVEAILHEIERITAATFEKQMVAIDVDGPDRELAVQHRTDIVATRIEALALQLGTKVTSPAKLREVLAQGKPKPNVAAIEASIGRFMRSDAFKDKLPNEPADVVERMSKAVAGLGEPPTDDAGLKAWRAKVGPAIASVLGKEPTDPMVDDMSFDLEHNVPDFWVEQHAKDRAAQVIEAGGLQLPEGDKAARFETFVGGTLLDLDLPKVLVPASKTSERADVRSMTTLVTGLPVLYRGLGNSVFNNQWNSLWFALVLVIGLKAILFRSLWTGVLTSIPTLLTLLVIYGAMGLVGVHLDIGTSMLASLIIGAGDDYAVEFLWSWSAPVKQSLEKAAARAAMDTGAGIWTNAMMVAVGFFVLTLGEARPLQNVGGLTAIAMVAAAVATFVVTPVLARRHHYAPVPAPVDEAQTEARTEGSEEASPSR